MDVPDDITSLPIDPNDTECNTTGAKGLGEPVTIPTASAIANAVYHATGVRMTENVLNPTTLALMLSAARRLEEGDMLPNFAYIRPGSVKEALDHSPRPEPGSLREEPTSSVACVTRFSMPRVS